MEQKTILIVDDEKNIRFAMSQALESPEYQIKTAINGEEALQVIDKTRVSLIFLDLKMPGIGGIEVLSRIKSRFPEIRVVIISAHGTIESAVEAMKLGAADFIQKPFTPNEIRELAARVLNRSSQITDEEPTYFALIEQTRQYISEQNFERACETARKAISADPGQPEAYNLLGVLLEIRGEWIEAQKFYRAARDINPSYKPACANLERTSSWNKEGKIDLGCSYDSAKAGNKRQ